MIWWKKTPAPAPDAAGIELLWQEAFGHHQAGRIDQAAKLYRSILKDAPDHFDARHLLGVAALQQGRLDEAQREIGEAIRINPRDAAALNNLGTTWLRKGDLVQARTSFESALKLRPGDPDANANLGAVLLRLGHPAAAVAPLRKAMAQRASAELRSQVATALLESGDAAGAIRELRITVREHPGSAAAHNHLALALEQGGDIAAALKSFDQALAIAPEDVSVASNRAALLARLGRFDEALATLEALVRKAPKSAAVRANLGALHRDRGDLAAARASLEAALELDPGLVPARLTLAGVLIDGGNIEDAQRTLDNLLRERPDAAEAWALRGRLAFARGELNAAGEALARAIELAPSQADFHHTLGLVRMASGDALASRRCHERAFELDPAHPQARWAAVMARLPAISASEEETAKSRQAFAAGLQELDRWYTSGRAASGFLAVGSTQPFYLAYQDGNHRELLRSYGRLCERLMKRSASAPAVLQRRPAPGPLRLGVVSAQFADHSVWTAIVRGWVQRLDRQRIELHFFDLRPSGDGQMQQAHRLAARVHQGPAGLAEWAQHIRDGGIDALLYPEIGMDAMTLRLASLRLAPLQLAAWGHPISTGLPTIDAFLSADAMEPPEAQDHYTEKLVRLPGLGVCYEPLDVPAQAIDLAALGLPADRPLLLCPGLPFKYAPRHDTLWAEIADRAPEALLVFFASSGEAANAALRGRLERAFAARGLNFEQCARVVPVLSRPQFFALMRRATLFLDSVGFSGFNTVMQAVECELPVVSLEGDALRGRFGAGVLRELGMDDCVAADATGYAGIAARLVKDPAARGDAKERLRSRRARVFGTEAPVRALEQFLLQGGRTG